jgi:phosphoglucomutase
MRIKFGTSGWRGLMGEDFTFHNVRVVVQAVCDYLLGKFPGEAVSVAVGYDTRFLSERYALEAAKVLARNGIRALIAERDAPSQALALQIIRRKCRAGVNFTASFNPPRYNGLKLNVETGAPALPEVTDAVEAGVQRIMPSFPHVPSYFPKEGLERVDFQADYLDFLQGRVDFEAVRKSGLRIAVDLLYGTSREYLDEILESNDIPVEEIHGYVDPYFGGVIPSCTEENLAELRALVLAKRCHIGIATDADGDRFGIIDEHGRFVHPNHILAMLLDYLARAKGWRGGVARSIATTHLIDRIARSFDLPLFKTKVGFKYIADLMLKGEIMFGGEESACMALRDHLPEKDGIMAGLLAAEMIAVTGRSLSELRQDLFRAYGTMVCGSVSVPLTPERGKKLAALAGDPPGTFAGLRVCSVETIEGVKFDFRDDAWTLLRLSGTEPLVRCYAEAGTRKEMELLLRKGIEALE